MKDKYKMTRAPEFEGVAKKIVGAWGYEESCWWKSIEESLRKAYASGFLSGLKTAEQELKKYSKYAELVCEAAREAEEGK